MIGVVTLAALALAASHLSRSIRRAKAARRELRRLAGLHDRAEA